ncbi:uncharacterized protein LOC115312195 [Ixodes scapularis]|uniref:uncharacterized protein LOC115312195 n=1 Tax=Ixodes scapularis TaxID=6945 RepID=UPI001A9D4CDE|nr:uncharacterized protein LOC115312195 [Ixodes scapularis]
MCTGLFVFFILAAVLHSWHEVNAKKPPYNATEAFYTKGTYYMKYRNYMDDWAFRSYNCVSRWGGLDKRPGDPITIRYETKGYDGDPYGHQYEMIVLFDKTRSDMFYYDAWRHHKKQNRKLIYLNATEKCQVIKTFYNKTSQGCTLWMDYYTVDENPPTRCENVYKKCVGFESTKIKYHDKCKYKQRRRQ